MKRVLSVFLICLFAAGFVFAEEVFRFVYLDGRIKGETVYESWYDYEYNENGSITRSLSPDGDVYTFSYDDHGNMIAQTLADFGSYEYEYEYMDHFTYYPGTDLIKRQTNYTLY